jgi:hypothetical protein
VPLRVSIKFRHIQVSCFLSGLKHVYIWVVPACIVILSPQEFRHLFTLLKLGGLNDTGLLEVLGIVNHLKHFEEVMFTALPRILLKTLLSK